MSDREGLGGTMREALSRFVTSREVHSRPATIGDVRVETVARYGALHTPLGAYAVKRPTAVIVRRGDREERVPIHDVTWVVFWALMALAAVFGLARCAAAMGRR